MKNILIATDKFKGSLTAEQACFAIKSGLIAVNPSLNITTLPLADGGEGSLKAIAEALNLEIIVVEVQDPLFRLIHAGYGLIGKDAFIEMAAASGLQLLNHEERNPMFTSTIGTGELIKDAIERGAKTIHLFVGGSATNDGGIGMAHALGYRFMDAHGNDLLPIGESLTKISKIEGGLSPRTKNIKFIVATDVSNSLLGKNGAAYTYASQKGATDAQIEVLERGLKHLAESIDYYLKINLADIPGSGAAGGMGAGAVAFLKAEIRKGTETIFDIVDFDNQLEGIDLVITGEGKLDNQTLQGKLVKGVIDRCARKGIPIAVLCGMNELTKQQTDKLNIASIKSIMDKAENLEAAINKAEIILEGLASELIKDLRYHSP